MVDPVFLHFPDGFTWGTATASYQIEGAVNEDGRGPSIWDTFSHTEGKTYNGHNGDVTVDHYHRYPEDIALMADMGVNAYRFSVAWPRVLPSGTGDVNSKGLDFYERVVDDLLKHNITPYITLFHWDLPQALQDKGGFAHRDITTAFAEYTRAVTERLGDRARHWITFNEPFIYTVLGHLLGDHAPGLTDPKAAFHAGYYMYIAHGMAMDVIRATVPQSVAGITLDYSPVHPASSSEEDVKAAMRYDLLRNVMWYQPLLKGGYPTQVLEMFHDYLPPVTDEDLAQMLRPMDFVGLNYYSRSVVKNNPGNPLTGTADVLPADNEYSMMWEIYPDGLYESLVRIHRDFEPAQIMVTENGICVPDDVDHDGNIRDYRRLRYLRDHFAAAHRAIKYGVPLTGYFVWSFMDNFEWAYGYRMRFGLVHVDFETQKRTPKLSAKWYADVVSNNGFAPAQDGTWIPL